jgi:hypothetical protein
MLQALGRVGEGTTANRHRVGHRGSAFHSRESSPPGQGGLFGTGTNDSFTARFNDARANEEVLLAELGHGAFLSK